MWGFRTLQSLWAETYHFWLAEMIQRSPYRLQRRVRQGRSTSFRACQHDSHNTGIWISSSYTVTCEVVEAEKDFPGKLKRTARYSKSPSCTAVKGQRDWQKMELQMRVETSLISVSGLFHFVENWRKPVIYIPPSELTLIFHHRGRKLFFRHEVNISNMPAKDKLGEKRKERKINHKSNLLGQRQKTSWLDWWSGGFPRGRKQCLQKSLIS